MNKVLEHGVLFHCYLKFHTYIYNMYTYAIFRLQNLTECFFELDKYCRLRSLTPWGFSLSTSFNFEQ